MQSVWRLPPRTWRVRPKPGEESHQYCFRPQIPIRIALMVALLAGVNAFAGSACSPFGDPPARVDRGWFARVVTARNSVCLGGTLLGPWIDPNGDTRFACFYEPRHTDERGPLPMLVFLHPSETSAYSVVLTGLLKLIDKGSLSDNDSGFILLAPQGRYTTHLYPGYDSNGLGWDNWYRQLSPNGSVTVGSTAYDENADAVSIDHFIEEMLAEGRVDRRRIYLMGWSNGAAMALLYALNRSWVAAAAVYSAPDPFSALFDLCTQTPVAAATESDGQARIFNPHVPLMHVRNDCDIGGICPNGSRFAARVRAFGGNIEDVILDSSGLPVSSCDAACGTDEMADGQIGTFAGLRGMARHMRWPVQWNELMLGFLKRHPLDGAIESIKNAPAHVQSPEER
jgi:predicted esterase